VLTYKSFNAMLQENLAPATRTLMVFPVIFDPDESDIRELYMPPALVETLAQNDPKKARDYCANIRAFLKRYIIGAEIDNHNYMKSWRDDVFEMRVQNQKKGERVRIFGAFGAPDKFVAFFRRPRNYFGDRYDPKWDREIERTVEAWDSMFPGCRRVAARPFSNCITSNCYDVNF